MQLSHKEQYLNMATESALMAVSVTEQADEASRRMQHSKAELLYDEARVHEKECNHFKQLAKECEE